VPPALKVLLSVAESDTDEPRTIVVAETVVARVGLLILTVTLVVPLLEL
jgi:hypothetical protein